MLKLMVHMLKAWSDHRKKILLIHIIAINLRFVRSSVSTDKRRSLLLFIIMCCLTVY